MFKLRISSESLAENPTSEYASKMVEMMKQARLAGADHEAKIIKHQQTYDTSKPVVVKVDDTAWIGVDLDGTLATYTKWVGWDHIGEPIQLMVDRVKGWIDRGIKVKIFTARVSKASCAMNGISYSQQARVIQKWCKKHIHQELEVVCEKDPFMLFCVDDSAVQIRENSGMALASKGFEVFHDRIVKHSKPEPYEVDK